MNLFESGKIFIITEPRSLRYRIPGLTLYLSAILDKRPENSGDWYVFQSPKGNVLRALHYGEGYAELYERKLTDGGRFPGLIRDAAKGLSELTREQLQALFSRRCGVIDFSRG